MNLKDIVLKNMSKNLKKYFSYFVSASFSIAIYYIYSTLLFNDTIGHSEDYKGLTKIFSVSLFAIIIFAVFFINYAHTTFMKSRSKEFAMFTILGMNRNSLFKMLLLENAVIFLASLVCGILSGMVFSRLFQLIVFRILDFKQFAFNLEPKAFLTTIVAFSLIFAIVILQSLTKIIKAESSLLLKEARKNEGTVKMRPAAGMAGICLIIVSVLMIFLFGSSGKKPGNLFYVADVMFLFSGVYLMVSNLAGLLIAMLKKSRHYHSNLLFISETTYRFKQNHRIHFVLSILVSIVIFLCTVSVTLYVINDKTVDPSQKNHIEFVLLGAVTNAEDQELMNVIDPKRNMIDVEKHEFLTIDTDSKKNILVTSLSSFTKTTSVSLQLPRGYAQRIVPQMQSYNYKGSTIDPVNTKLSFKFTGEIRSEWIAGSKSFPYELGLVVNDDDYRELLRDTPISRHATYYVLNKITGLNYNSTTKSLRDYFKSNNQQVSVVSRKEIFDVFQKGYALFIFISVFIGLLFFIASGGILYFKQFSEVDTAKAKFKNLYRIGIPKKEISGVVTKEFSLSFYLPIIVGGIISYALMFLIIETFGLSDIISQYIPLSASVLLAYTFIQTLFYLISRRAFLKEVFIGFSAD